jgi:hypothetical protein
MRYSLLSLIILLFLFATTGCHHGDAGEIKPVYEGYKFDPKVIEKLPLYDSLVTAIIEKASFFQDYINSKDSYRAYRYMPNSNDDEVHNKLPKDIDIGIEPYITVLGKDFIYGFDVFKDSSIKIYIRRAASEKSYVDIEENLSYHPAGHTMRHREFPVKDTVLNQHWQYWSRFNKRGLF